MIQQLILYRGLLNDPLIRDYNQLISWYNSNDFDQNDFKDLYYKLCSALVNRSNDYIYSIKDYLAFKLLESDNRFTFSAQSVNDLSDKLSNVLLHDLTVMQKLFRFDLKKLSVLSGDSSSFISYSEHNQTMIHDMMAAFMENQDEALIHKLSSIYKTYGSGIFAFHKAFKIDEMQNIEGIKHFSPQTFDTLFGYEHNKGALIKNIESFTDGNPYHHALLVGDNGTGKSSSVRALVPHFSDKGLKLIEIKKYQIHQIPKLFDAVLNRQGKFIFFIDDLTFEIEESDYKFLKSIIEGSADIIPENVCFCVTSNRRHIIKEVRDDRESQIHISDALNENASLSDRFGLFLHYQKPSQMAYINMVKNYMEHYKINYTIDQLRPLALQFSRQMGGCSGRVAKQFITNIESGLMKPN